MTATNEHGHTFCQYLIGLHGRTGALGELVAAAKSEQNFPRDGCPDDVRSHLAARHAHPDLRGAVDAAETEWLGA